MKNNTNQVKQQLKLSLLHSYLLNKITSLYANVLSNNIILFSNVNN